MNFTQKDSRNLCVAGLMVILGVALRLACQDYPNVAPVAAMALFAGYYCKSRSLALAVPLAIMLLSDCFLGGYEGGLMLAVYASLLFPVALRPIVRRNAQFQSAGAGSIVRTCATIAGCSMAASVLFFATTNFAVWMLTNVYPNNVSGLVQCYIQGLPFFRYTFLGDLVFSGTLFGAYATALNLLAARNPSRTATTDRGTQAVNQPA